MCEYCGCQATAAIAALTEEHDRIRAVADEAVRLGRAGDLAASRRLLEELRELLAPHTAIEERGLFPAMTDDFGPAMAALCADHDRLDAALDALLGGSLPVGRARLGWVDELGRTVEALFEHILREQDGVFPAAMSVLTGEQWEHLDAVRAGLSGADRSLPAPIARPA